MQRTEQRRRTFESQTDPYMDHLYQFALLWTGEEEAAENLVVETVVTAYRVWEAFAPRVPTPVRLFSVLRGLARKTAAEAAPADRHATNVTKWEPPEPEAAVGMATWGKERSTAEELREALQGLPLESRELFLLHLTGRLRYREIAQVIGCSPRRVRDELAWSRKELQRTLLRRLAHRN